MSASFLSFFKPKPGAFGQNLFCTSAAVGTFGGTTVGGTTTTAIEIPKPVEKAFLVGVAINCSVVCLSNGGTVLAQIIKGTSTALTAATSIEADFLTAVNTTFNVPITGTVTQRVFAKSDALRVDVVAGSTIDTQPVIIVTATWAMME